MVELVVFARSRDAIAPTLAIIAAATQRILLADNLRVCDRILRAVLFFATRPLSLSDVEFLDWVPYLDRRGEDDDARRQVDDRIA
jgi:hypothetical protein